MSSNWDKLRVKVQKAPKVVAANPAAPARPASDRSREAGRGDDKQRERGVKRKGMSLSEAVEAHKAQKLEAMKPPVVEAASQSTAVPLVPLELEPLTAGLKRPARPTAITLADLRTLESKVAKGTSLSM